MKYPAIFIIKIYQKLLSPFLPNSCRFVPTCSEYSVEAFRVHGFFMGIYLSAKRILRCNPFCDFGYDPVPGKKCCSDNLKKLEVNN